MLYMHLMQKRKEIPEHVMPARASSLVIGVKM